MIEKVNPSHPDKVADRIAGAIVDKAYLKSKFPKIAVEVLIGHNNCHIIIETDVEFKNIEIEKIVNRIVGEKIITDVLIVPQDINLEKNQIDKLRCGDNGIFKGNVLTKEERVLSKIAKKIYEKHQFDGKYILDNNKIVICQSNVEKNIIMENLKEFLNLENKKVIINPLGYWYGGINVDTGATNRKIGSDMGKSITGGGLHGKDLSKADVSINIYAFLKAQKLNKNIELSCAIGDEFVDGKPYCEIVKIAKDYIKSIGGFEEFAKWGLL